VFLEAWTTGTVTRISRLRNSSIRSSFPSNISALSKKKMMPILPITFGALHISRDSHLHEICGMDLDHPMAIEVIADQLLKRGYPTRVAEKIVGANFARAFNDIWTT
jgi:hypothetical protein